MPYTGRAVEALPSSVQLLNQMNTKVLDIQIYARALGLEYDTYRTEEGNYIINIYADDDIDWEIRLNSDGEDYPEDRFYIPLEYAYNKLKARYDLVVNLNVACPF